MHTKSLRYLALLLAALLPIDLATGDETKYAPFTIAVPVPLLLIQVFRFTEFTCGHLDLPLT